MSRIVFSTKSGKSAEVRGSERHRFGYLCNQLFAAVLQVPSFSQFDLKKMTAFKKLFLESSWIDKMDSANELHFKDYVFKKILYGDPGFNWDISPFSLILNTALRIGSDEVRLAARLHGQCEIHSFVRPDNSLWLAGIIQRGRRCGIFNKDMGWEELLHLLGEARAANEIVVSSYSVCEDFPNREVAKHPRDWEELTEGDKWDRALDVLLDDHSDRELQPSNWQDYYFDMGWDALKINALVESSQLL